MSVDAPPTQPLAALAWIGVPALAAVAATLALGIPFRLFGLALPEPVFPMALAFAWAVIRPSLLGPFVLLLLGVFLDLYWGDSKGLWALSLLIAYGVLLSGRSLLIGQTAGALAAWYVAAAALAFAAAFTVTAVGAHVMPSLTATGLQFVVTIALFPLAYGLIRRFEDADIRFR